MLVLAHDEVTCAPVALDEAPLAVEQHGVPRVGELARLDLHAGLVADALRVALDVHAAYARVAAQAHEQRVIGLRAELDAAQQAERRVLHRRVLTHLTAIVELDGVEVLDGDPAKDGATLGQLAAQAGRELSDKLGIRGRLVRRLGHADRLLVDVLEDARVLVQVALASHRRLRRRQWRLVLLHTRRRRSHYWHNTHRRVFFDVNRCSSVVVVVDVVVVVIVVVVDLGLGLLGLGQLEHLLAVLGDEVSGRLLLELYESALGVGSLALALQRHVALERVLFALEAHAQLALLVVVDASTLHLGLVGALHRLQARLPLLLQLVVELALLAHSFVAKFLYSEEEKRMNPFESNFRQKLV